MVSRHLHHFLIHIHFHDFFQKRSLLLYPGTRNVFIPSISIFVVFWERRAFKVNYDDLMNFTSFIIYASITAYYFLIISHCIFFCQFLISPPSVLLGIVLGPSATVFNRSLTLYCHILTTNNVSLIFNQYIVS